MIVLEKNRKSNDKSKAFALPSFANNIVDTNGTGDALLAPSLSLAKTKSLFISNIMSSLAAADECEKDGNGNNDEIIKKINSIKTCIQESINKKLKTFDATIYDNNVMFLH